MTNKKNNKTVKLLNLLNFVKKIITQNDKVSKKIVRIPMSNLFQIKCKVRF